MITKKGYAFSKEKHHHSFDDKPLYGTTTVLNIIAKPQLIPWAVKMATENIKSQWKTGKAYTKEERDIILEGGRVRHTNAKTEAGDVGTKVHEAISKWIKKGCPNEMPVKTFCGKDVEVTKMFMQFVEWALENNIQFISSETNVFSTNNWYGGIIDFVCTIDNHLYIGDIKTSSGIYPEHWLQIGAYDIARQEMTGSHADGYIIVNIPRENKMQIQKTSETEIYRDGFLHALELYKIMKKIK
jgi:hypothetical protein